MNRCFFPTAHLLSTALVLALLTACGASPSSSTPAQVASENADAPSSGSDTSSPAREIGSNRARFEVDGEVHEFSSKEGGMDRIALLDAPEMELVSFEALTKANDRYVKVDVNVAKGGDPEGEYVVGNLSTPDHHNVLGHGQVTLAIEKDAASGRDMYAGGTGTITIKRQGDQYRVDFRVAGDGVFRPLEAPPIIGYVQVDALPN